MAARAAVALAAGRRVAAQNGSPLLASCRRGAQNHSSSAQPEEQNGGGGAAAAMTGAQVEAALNRKNVEVPVETVGALELQPEDAWVPDQDTGVFAPADESTGGSDNHSNPGAGSPSSSVLDQTVFVREEDMEDVERPAMANANESAK